MKDAIFAIIARWLQAISTRFNSWYCPNCSSLIANFVVLGTHELNQQVLDVGYLVMYILAISVNSKYGECSRLTWKRLIWHFNEARFQCG